jgi:hypothetical protein
MNTALYNIALATYAAARAAGSLHSDAAAAAWIAVRAAPEGNRLRCPYWDEGGWHSTGTLKSYRLPLGEVMFGADFVNLGGHSAKWPRTKASKEAMAAAGADFRARIEAASASVSL